MGDERFEFRPIGVIHTPYQAREGTPIQGAFEPDAEGTVEVYEQFAEGLKDIEGFSHIYVFYVFHKSEEYKLHCKPYRDDEPRGVFACRAPKRPNQLGMSVVRLLKREGNVLTIGEVDMLDGSPLLDIKPYVPQFDQREDVRVGWLQGSFDRQVADDRF